MAGVRYASRLIVRHAFVPGQYFAVEVLVADGRPVIGVAIVQ